VHNNGLRLALCGQAVVVKSSMGRGGLYWDTRGVQD